MTKIHQEHEEGRSLCFVWRFWLSQQWFQPVWWNPWWCWRSSQAGFIAMAAVCLQTSVYWPSGKPEEPASRRIKQPTTNSLLDPEVAAGCTMANTAWRHRRGGQNCSFQLSGSSLEVETWVFCDGSVRGHSHTAATWLYYNFRFIQS